MPTHVFAGEIQNAFAEAIRAADPKHGVAHDPRGPFRAAVTRARQFFNTEDDFWCLMDALCQVPQPDERGAQAGSVPRDRNHRGEPGDQKIRLAVRILENADLHRINQVLLNPPAPAGPRERNEFFAFERMYLALTGVEDAVAGKLFDDISSRISDLWWLPNFSRLVDELQWFKYRLEGLTGEELEKVDVAVWSNRFRRLFGGISLMLVDVQTIPKEKPEYTAASLALGARLIHDEIEIFHYGVHARRMNLADIYLVGLLENDTRENIIRRSSEIWRKGFWPYEERLYPYSVDRNYYGAWLKEADGSQPYLAGMYVKNLPEVPRGLVARHLLPARYAAFDCLESELPAKYKQINECWLPASGLEEDNRSAVFELYPQSARDDGTRPVQIYVPVKRKQIKAIW